MHSLVHEEYARALAAERLARCGGGRRRPWRRLPPPPPPRPPGRGGGLYAQPFKLRERLTMIWGLSHNADVPKQVRIHSVPQSR